MADLSINLWFDNQAVEAAKFYASIFKDSKIFGKSDYPDEGQEITGQEAGSVMVVEFELNGMHFVALNGGPQFKFNEAVSIIVKCADQEEVDYYWERLSAVPEAEQCGWLKDKFGVSWQIVPEALNRLMSDPDPKKAEAVMHVMLKQHKLDVSELQKAYDEA